MEHITETQYKTSMENLFAIDNIDSTIIDIESPTSNEYINAHSRNTSSIQNSVAEYAEAYISLGQYYI